MAERARTDGWDVTYLDGAVTDVNFLDILRIWVPLAVRDPVAKELAQDRVRWWWFPRDVQRAGAGVVGNRRHRFARWRWGRKMEEKKLNYRYEHYSFMVCSHHEFMGYDFEFNGIQVGIYTGNKTRNTQNYSDKLLFNLNMLLH